MEDCQKEGRKGGSWEKEELAERSYKEFWHLGYLTKKELMLLVSGTRLRT